MRISPESIAAHLPALRRYARVLVRDPGRADDLVQDCLERALSRWRLWRPSGEVRAWLSHQHEAQLTLQEANFLVAMANADRECKAWLDTVLKATSVSDQVL